MALTALPSQPVSLSKNILTRSKIQYQFGNMPIQVGEADEQVTVATAFAADTVNSFWPYSPI
jgi:hypothetical protein